MALISPARSPWITPIRSSPKFTPPTFPFNNLLSPLLPPYAGGWSHLLQHGQLTSSCIQLPKTIVLTLSSYKPPIILQLGLGPHNLLLCLLEFRMPCAGNDNYYEYMSAIVMLCQKTTFRGTFLHLPTLTLFLPPLQ